MMTLSDSESTIAGKTEDEILAMNRYKRYRLYKTLSPESKEEAMRTVETVRRVKISQAYTPERKAKQSAFMTGRTLSEETKAKIGVGNMGEKNPSWNGDAASDRAKYLRTWRAKRRALR